MGLDTNGKSVHPPVAWTMQHGAMATSRLLSGLYISCAWVFHWVFPQGGFSPTLARAH